MEAGEILLRRGLLDSQQLERARSGNGDGISLVDAAVELGYVDESKALQAVGEEVGLDFVDLALVDPDLSLLKGFPSKLIYRQLLFPIRKDNGQLVVATPNPFDLYPIDEAAAATGFSVMPVLASRMEIDKLIKDAQEALVFVTERKLPYTELQHRLDELTAKKLAREERRQAAAEEKSEQQKEEEVRQLRQRAEQLEAEH